MRIFKIVSSVFIFFLPHILWCCYSLIFNSSFNEGFLPLALAPAINFITIAFGVIASSIYLKKMLPILKISNMKRSAILLSYFILFSVFSFISIFNIYVYDFEYKHLSLVIYAISASLLFIFSLFFSNLYMSSDKWKAVCIYAFLITTSVLLSHLNFSFGFTLAFIVILCTIITTLDKVFIFNKIHKITIFLLGFMISVLFVASGIVFPSLKSEFSPTVYGEKLISFISPLGKIDLLNKLRDQKFNYRDFLSLESQINGFENSFSRKDFEFDLNTEIGNSENMIRVISLLKLLDERSLTPELVSSFANRISFFEKYGSYNISEKTNVPVMETVLGRYAVNKLARFKWSDKSLVSVFDETNIIKEILIRNWIYSPEEHKELFISDVLIQHYNLKPEVLDFYLNLPSSKNSCSSNVSFELSLDKINYCLLRRQLAVVSSVSNFRILKINPEVPFKYNDLVSKLRFSYD